MVVARDAQNLANSNTTTILEDTILCRMKVYASVHQIASFINSELFSLPSTTNKLMENNIITLHFPQYYLPPNEAKAQDAFV